MNSNVTGQTIKSWSSAWSSKTKDIEQLLEEKTYLESTHREFSLIRKFQCKARWSLIGDCPWRRLYWEQTEIQWFPCSCKLES